MPLDPFADNDTAAAELWDTFTGLVTALMGKGFSDAEARELTLAVMVSGIRRMYHPSGLP
jgi:hypothetical protein